MNPHLKAMIIMIGILIASILAITYAFYQFVASEGSDDLGGIVRCFDFDFQEGTSAVQKNVALPVTDAQGVASDPFTFTITNTCDRAVGYQVQLIIEDRPNNLDFAFIGYTFSQNSLGTPSRLNLTAMVEDNQLIRELRVGQLTNRGDYVTYDLRLWMAEEAADYYELVEGRSFASRIRVIATALR